MDPILLTCPPYPASMREDVLSPAVTDVWEWGWGWGMIPEKDSPFLKEKGRGKQERSCEGGTGKMRADIGV